MIEETLVVLKRISRPTLSNDSLEYWFAGPAIVVLLALVIVPMVWSLYTSFTSLNLIAPGNHGAFVGLENYATVLTNHRFYNDLFNTAIYVGGGVFVQFVIGFAIALIMAKYTKGMLSTALFTVLLLPMMMAPIIVGYIWRLLLQSTFGPVDYVLKTAFGMAPIQFLSSTQLSLFSVMFADIWQWTPFLTLILYTGRIAINEDLYEAARIDGAGRWFTFRHVTLPQMKGVIAVALLLRAMDAFKFFDKMFVMTRGGPGTSSELITYLNYLRGFNDYAMGHATAMSWILVVVTVILANLFLYVLERTEGGEEIA